jgi:hypothetical protein
MRPERRSIMDPELHRAEQAEYVVRLDEAIAEVLQVNAANPGRLPKNMALGTSKVSNNLYISKLKNLKRKIERLSDPATADLEAGAAGYNEAIYDWFQIRAWCEKNLAFPWRHRDAGTAGDDLV